MGYERVKQQELIADIVFAMGEMTKREIKAALGKRVPDMGTLTIWLVDLVDQGILTVAERGANRRESGGTAVVRTVVYSVASQK